jgi:hypothetical protein
MVVVPARKATQPGAIGSLKSILGLLKSLKIRSRLIGCTQEKRFWQRRHSKPSLLCQDV